MEHPAPTSAAPARELAPRLVSVATFAVLALIGTVAVPAVGLAQPSCTRDVETWGQSCADRTGISLTVRFCDVDAIVLRAGTEGFEEHDYEIRGNPEGMFRDVGGIGLAPIGSFVWDEAPPGMHQTFDALVECLEHGVPEAASFRGVQSPPGRLWLLPLALVLVAFVFERRRRGAHVHWRVGATLGGIVVATLFARVALVGFGFFHQNGQGPMWVDYALCHGLFALKLANLALQLRKVRANLRNALRVFFFKLAELGTKCNRIVNLAVNGLTDFGLDLVCHGLHAFGSSHCCGDTGDHNNDQREAYERFEYAEHDCFDLHDRRFSMERRSRARPAIPAHGNCLGVRPLKFHLFLLFSSVATMVEGTILPPPPP